MANILGRRQYNARSSRVIPNVMPAIILIDKDIKRAHYLALLGNLKKGTTKAETINWDTDTFAPITDTLSAAVASTTTTTLPVSNPSYYLPGELWQNKRTDEIVRIVSVNLGTSNIEVTRAVTALNSSGGTAAANMSSGDQLNQIASLVGESSSRQITRTTTPSAVYNYTQKFRKDLSLSDRQIKREMLNDNEMPYQQMKMLKEFRMELDRTFLWGQRAAFTDSTTGKYTTTTGGIRAFISTNILDVGGTLYKSAFDEFLMNYGSRYSTNKVLLCSNAVILAFTQMLDSIAQVNVPIKGTKGATIMTQALKYADPNGNELLIMEDRNISEQRPGEAYGVDMSELRYVEFSNNGISGAMKFKADTQDPDDDGWAGTVSGDIGLTYGFEKAHFTLKNVSGGSFSVPLV